MNKNKPESINFFQCSFQRTSVLSQKHFCTLHCKAVWTHSRLVHTDHFTNFKTYQYVWNKYDCLPTICSHDISYEYLV